MSLAFPVARSLTDALAPGTPFARSRAEAARLAGDGQVTGLETGWLALSAAEADDLLARFGADGAAGYLQRYENTAGQTVLAVSWWRVVPGAEGAADIVSGEVSRQVDMRDHTDDLYFRRRRTTPSRRRWADPNQLDLFAEPEGG